MSATFQALTYKKIKMKILYILLFLGVLFSGCQQEKSSNHWEVLSPDSTVKITLDLNDSSKALFYQVAKIVDGKEITVLEPSKLGINFQEGNFSENLSFANVEAPKLIDENYSMVSGKQKTYHNHATELTISFTNANKQPISLSLRAYDEGAAFKYEIAEDGKNQAYTLKEELSGFNLPDDGTAWMHPYDTIVWWAPGYETYYEEMPIGSKAPDNKNGWAFPMLFQSNNLFMLITEANIQGHYPAMHLKQDCVGGNYQVTKPVFNEAYDICGAEPTVNIPFETPWRIITIGENLGEIVESNMVTHVSDSSKVKDTSWIKPGRASWSWWSDEESCRDYGKLKEFVDFSADFGWEYSLVDANWNEMKGGDLQQLAAYANSKNVGILAWYNSGGKNNVVTEQPRDLMNDAEIRRAEFKKLQEWGVKGVKIDFFQSDKPCIMQQYVDILNDAAEFEILVNFHGCTLPKGWRRTFPNLMTMEAVKGAEAYRFGRDFPENGPAHCTILPFSRNVVGPIDFTPTGLTDRKYPHLTTFAHELALPVILESGIQHLCDHFTAYQALPDFAKDYLKVLPANWDATKFVAGYPGDFVVLARKSGDSWYLAGINGLNQVKTISLDLSFLEEGKEFEAKSIQDDEGVRTLKSENRKVNTGDHIELELKPYGGFVTVLK